MARTVKGFKRWIALAVGNIVLLLVMVLLIINMKNKCNQIKKTCELKMYDETCVLTINTNNSTISCSPVKCDLEAGDSKSVDCYYDEDYKCPTLECYNGFTVAYIIIASTIFLGEIVYLVFWCCKNKKNDNNDVEPKPKELHSDTIFVEDP